MSDDVLVKVDNVSKRFCRSLKRSLWYGLQDLGSELSGRRRGGGERLPRSSADVDLRKDEFWAVKDVSFELRRGECLGLIGRNGAGKTTLLRMLNGLIKPDSGSISVKGTTGALIALGAGFNPVLTGRENIRISASLIGLSEKDTRSMMDEIIDFSGIEQFVDTPVQSYSSGMKVRLGFAVASSIKPDILFLDEVLAVGDAAFRSKCYNRIGKLRETCGIVFVSHEMNHISAVTSKVVHMEKGQAILFKNPLDGIKAYDKSNFQSESLNGEGFCAIEKPIVSASLEIDKRIYSFNSLLRLSATISSLEDLDECLLRINIYNLSGEVVAEFRTRATFSRGMLRYEIELGPICLVAGSYSIGFVINTSNGITIPFWSLKQLKFTMSGKDYSPAPYLLPGRLIYTKSQLP
jgi:lipopolysaccharide transport system ATP-binding protein